MTSLVPPSIKLLVVEDEPALRQMLEILFRREGYSVVTAPGFKAAIESIAQHPAPFPVVLTDLATPVVLEGPAEADLRAAYAAIGGRS